MTALEEITQQLAEQFGVSTNSAGDLLRALRQTAFKAQMTDAQLISLLIVAKQYGLNPWTKEIYAFPDKQNGIIPVVGVDGWARIINENPQFDGMDFTQDDESCTCTIYRKDRAHPVKVTEYMDECYRPAFKAKDGRMITGPWQSHKRRMLRHKALIQCSRLAFGFVGIFDADEAERIVESVEYDPEKQIEQPKEIEFCTDEKFQENKEKWKKIIEAGKTPEDLINRLSEKTRFNAVQIEEIKSWGEKND